MGSWLLRLRQSGFLVQSALLLAAVVVVYGAVAPVAAYLVGTDGLVAAAVAGGLCLLGAELALLLCRRYRGPKEVWKGALLAMLPRMGIPLAAALVLQLLGGTTARGGVLLLLLVFYPVTLTLETALTLPGNDEAQPASGVSRNGTS